jgi:hypothetical protein
MRHYMQPTLALALVALAACNGPRRIRERPIMTNGDRVPSPERTVERANEAGTREQQSIVRSRDSVYQQAVGSCRDELCAYVVKGEVALGMSPAEVMAATRTSPQAWTWRASGDAGVLVPRAAGIAPRDANGELVMVQFRDRRVAALSFRETQGIRVVASPLDTVGEERMLAAAEALIKEGDQFLAAGDRARALDRFDRASVLKAEDPHLEYRIATLLDLQLRPLEAQIRYQRFLNNEEIRLIQARGTANAQLAEAIAQARQRVLILERSNAAATPAPAPVPAPAPPAPQPVTVEVKVSPTPPAPAPAPVRPDTVPPR